ncbi:HSP20-like chaperone [Multifurca ochricompacta]|uniref:HSP20-like chaperone n=1 Tax=Multifurca ochricompacta TaxID=376703 RepID=A0AAD4MBQ1_9AGAM|nr:HSP20-like chaperone [Multifurca ochricompacta]
MSKHPEVLWAQRSSELDEEKNVLFVTVNLPDIIEDSLQYDLQPTKLSFKAKAGAGGPTTYEFSIDFYKEIIPEETRKVLTSRYLSFVLRKKESELEYWPRLTKDKVKNAYIKTDFSKWVDEDEQEHTGTTLDDDINPLGGLGDNFSGGMDFEKMMSSMGGGAGVGGLGGPPDIGAAAQGGPDSESDSDDAGPPGLE